MFFRVSLCVTLFYDLAQDAKVPVLTMWLLMKLPLPLSSLALGSLISCLFAMHEATTYKPVM